MNTNLIHVVTEQFLQGTQFVGILVVNVVITGYDIHCDTILSEFLQEVVSVCTQCFVVDKPTMLQCITKMDNMLDVVLKHVREKYLRVKVVLVLYKDVGTISYPDMRII